MVEDARSRAYQGELGIRKDYDSLGSIQSSNLYRYAENNSVNYVDSNGVILTGYVNRAKDASVRAQIYVAVMSAVGCQQIKKQILKQLMTVNQFYRKYKDDIRFGGAPSPLWHE